VRWWRFLLLLAAALIAAAARTLAARTADAGMFSSLLEAFPEKASDYAFGRTPNGGSSQSWTWQEPPSADRYRHPSCDSAPGLDTSRSTLKL